MRRGGLAGELRAYFFDLVAQRDHMVEAVAGKTTKVLGEMPGDVDTAALAIARTALGGGA